MPARAQTGSSAGIPMIRDAEIEQLLREYSQPILRVAGLSQQNIQIVIINDKSFNAFVMDAHRIFVNSGALMQATTPNQLDRRLRARDRPHRRRPSVEDAPGTCQRQTAAIVAMLLGVGAMVGGGEIQQLRQQPGHGQYRRRGLQRAAVLSCSIRCSPISAPKRTRPTAPACVS